MTRFYSNENLALQVVTELRRLGHDVLTSLDAAKANSAVPDIEVLAFAAAEKRILLVAEGGRKVVSGEGTGALQIIDAVGIKIISVGCDQGSHRLLSPSPNGRGTQRGRQRVTALPRVESRLDCICPIGGLGLKI